MFALVKEAVPCSLEHAHSSLCRATGDGSQIYIKPDDELAPKLSRLTGQEIGVLVRL